jgi:Domain of unknown function (DUF4383)
MLVRYGVGLISVVYVTLGLIGFLPIEAINPFHPEGVGAHYLLHQVAIDTFHSVFHLAIGLTGLWAAQSLRTARWWGKLTGAVLLVLFLAGMLQAGLQGFPVDQVLLGLVTLNSAGHILHLTTGALALYLGTVAPQVIPDPVISPS